MKKETTIAICSGGIDSVSMAAMYKEDNLIILSFNYGQKGLKELEVAKAVAEKLGATFKSIDISFIKELYGDSNQLTSENVSVEKDYKPSVNVPLRNGLFLQIAMCYGYSIKADRILLGSHLTDAEEVDGERMYPDCSYEFYKAYELAMDLGTFRKDKKIKIVAPSTTGLTKSELIKKGYELLGDYIFETWSCYKSEGKQCGNCESCMHRKQAFAKSGIEDKTVYGI